MRKIVCFMLAFLLLVSTHAPNAAFAALDALPTPELTQAPRPTVQHGAAHFKPADVDIWEDGCNIYIRYNGEQYQLGADASVSDNQIIRDYLVTVETYPDIDGELVTVIYFNIMYQVSEHDFAFKGESLDFSGGVYHDIYFSDVPRGCNKWNPTIYYVTIKNGKMSEVVKARVVHGTGGFTAAHEGTIYADDRFAERSGRIYVTPFTQGRYKIYCSRPVRKNLDGDILYPETPLPGISSSADESGLYKTTFRMLAGDATVYNTFYYTSSYQSGTDAISAAGTVRMDATQLSDGTTHRQLLTAPQLLCQISSYGTVYDIVYTNDDNLCSLLGIEKPAPKYWDVSAQEWKSDASGNPGGGVVDPGKPVVPWDEFVTDIVTPDNTNPFEYADSIPAIRNTTVLAYGSDTRISYADYSRLYGNALLYVATDTSNAAEPWALGSSLSWTLGNNTSGQDIGLRIVARVKVKLADGKTEERTLVLSDYNGNHIGNNKNWSVSAAGGQCKIALYDLIIELQKRYYSGKLPAKFLGVEYALTPFYAEDGKYYRGKSSYVTHVVDAEFNSVPSDDSALDPVKPWDPIVDGSMWDSIKEIFGAIPDFISGVFDTLSSLISGIGKVAFLLGMLFPFLPAEVLYIIQFGIQACILIGVFRWIRG